MDPEEAARLMHARAREATHAFREGNIREARRAVKAAFGHYRDLSRWMRGGGFRPKNLAVALAALRRAQDTIAGFTR